MSVLREGPGKTPNGRYCCFVSERQDESLKTVRCVCKPLTRNCRVEGELIILTYFILCGCTMLLGGSWAILIITRPFN